MNNQYQCFDRDLTTDCAQKLIQELFKGQTIRRREIVNAVFEKHHERGGTNSGVRPSVIQSALKSMKGSGLAANPQRGVWSITYYIRTLNEFTEWASQFDSGEGSKQYLFRGVSSANYKIDASAYRRIKKGRNGEDQQDGDFEQFLQINKDLIREARFRGHGRKDGRRLEDLEVLAEFQHYGAATFLMDFTYNALVALWFACKKSSGNVPKDGKVVAVPPNDPKFTDQTGEFSVITLDSLEEEIDKLTLDNKRLYQWQPRQQQNERIIAQQSIFLFGVLEIEINPDEECIIDRNSKKNIRESLKRIYGITEDMLFPDFDGFARQYSQGVPYTELTASQYKEHGIRAYQRREYTDAFANFDMAIGRDPDDAEAYYQRGLVRLPQKEYDAAISDFDTAIGKKRDYVEAYYQRGLVKSTLELYLEAIKDYGDAIRLGLSDYEVYNKRGVAFGKTGDWEHAIQDFTTTLQFQPDDAKAYYNRGIAYVETGDWEHAIQDFTTTLQFQPDDAEIYYRRGVAKSELGDFTEAEEDLLTALRLAQQARNENLIFNIDQYLLTINS
ncbi:MAG: tetratricopeptide repeat protein [Candidatus Poribacteria bacterium]|nr:tetratricopeptide repeat protein [Candidatus Poribacteria bacterium]